MERRHSVQPFVLQVAVIVAAILLLATVVVLVLRHHPELFKTFYHNDGQPAGDTGELQKFQGAIDKVKPVANVTLGSASGLGLAGGGVAAALGHPAGMQILTKSAAAGGFVILGNGFVE